MTRRAESGSTAIAGSQGDSRGDCLRAGRAARKHRGGGGGHLQAAGLIQDRRGHITVDDRPGLEELVCECYAVTTHESGDT